MIHFLPVPQSLGPGADGQLLRDLLKATDGLTWLHDSLQEMEATSQKS